MYVILDNQNTTFINFYALLSVFHSYNVTLKMYLKPHETDYLPQLQNFVLP